MHFCPYRMEEGFDQKISALPSEVQNGSLRPRVMYIGVTISQYQNTNKIVLVLQLCCNFNVYFWGNGLVTLQSGDCFWPGKQYLHPRGGAKCQ